MSKEVIKNNINILFIFFLYLLFLIETIVN